MKKEQILELVKEHFEEGGISDDGSCSEYGSYDEAFDLGSGYGEITFARNLIQQLKLEVQIAPHLK